MDLDFSIGKGITMDFSIGGGAPAPAPAPVAVYDNWAGVADPCLMGFVTEDFEEVQDGD